jgi:ribosomal-protein-alanine N-acetyltransferase
MAGSPDVQNLIELRPMTEPDLDAVVHNEFFAYAFPWIRSIFVECLNAGNECWVACIEKDIVGHAVLSIGGGESHLLNVCISRALQGNGYGRELVLHMLARARRGGADALFLEVRPSNVVASELYASLGFSEVGLRKDYYPSHLGHEDARVLVLDLESYFGE